MLSILLISYRKNRLSRIFLIVWLIADPFLLSSYFLQKGYRYEDFKPPDRIIQALKQYPNPVRIASIQPRELRSNLLNPFADWLCIKYGIERAGGYEPLCMIDTLQFLTIMEGTGDIKETMWGFRLWGFSRPDFYSLAGVTHIISPQPINNPYLEFIKLDHITMPHFHGGWWQDKPLYLYRNKAVLPRAFILNKIRNETIRPISIGSTSPNRMSFSIDTEKQREVVISESFHPGWVATTGDKEIELRPYMNTFISFKVPPGQQEITLEFRPESFYHGLRLTIAGLLLAVFVLFYHKMFNSASKDT